MYRTLLFIIIFFYNFTYAQVGIGTINIHQSAIMELKSSDRGFLLPRLSTSDRENIINPGTGLMIYNTNLKCLEVNNGTPLAPVWSCLGSAGSAILNATGSFQGNYQTIALDNSHTFQVEIENTGSIASSVLNFTVNDLTFANINGITVNSVSPSSATLNANESIIVTYNLSGTPLGTGVLTGNWSNGVIQSNSNTNVTAPPVLWTINCSGFSGTFNQGIGMTNSNKFEVLITNSGLTSQNLTLNTNNLAISGVNGIAIASITPNNIQNLAPGASQLVTYTFVGTPSSTGVLTGTWTNGSLNCSNNVNITAPPPSWNVSCSGFTGNYIINQALQIATNTFQVTVTNTGSINQTLNLANNNLTISGVNGVSVHSVLPSSINLNPNQSQVITYRLTGAPTSAGVITGNWANGSSNCSNNKSVAPGDAVFSLPKIVNIVSVSNSNPSVDIAGQINNSTKKITVQIPYTGGFGSYNSYTGLFTSNIAGTGQGNDMNSFRINYPAGNFSASGSITATIVVDGDQSFNVKKLTLGTTLKIVDLDFQCNGISKGNVTIMASGGILDKNFNNGNDHKFVYLPVQGADNRIWLNMALGANYANTLHSNFNPNSPDLFSQRYNKNGSLFQWGRKADGHELINWVRNDAVAINNASAGGNHAKNGTTNLKSNNPTHSNFIARSDGTWMQNLNVNAWNGVNAVNNPCPSAYGFRVPTKAEFDALKSASNPNGGVVNVIERHGYRNHSNGSLTFFGSAFFHVANLDANNLAYYVENVDVATGDKRGYGYAIRCIKDQNF